MKLKITLITVATLCFSVLGAHAQDVQDRTIRWGHLNSTDHPVSLGVKKFAEVLRAKSNGKLKIQEYPSSQLGGEIQQQSALRGGSQEMFSSSTSSLAGIVKEFGLLDFPFTVTSSAQSDALVDGPFGVMLTTKLAEKDIIGLSYWDLGFRNITNSRRAINKVEDMAGLKLRVIPNPVYVESFKALNVNPVPMNFSEVYGALESKAIDGQENPLSVILSSNLFEVQKYLTASNHVYTTPIVLMSKKFWEKLSPTEQKMFIESAAEAKEYQRRINREYNAKALSDLQSKGMLYNQLSASEQSKLQAITQPIADNFAASYDQSVVKLFKSEVQRIRASVK